MLNLIKALNGGGSIPFHYWYESNNIPFLQTDIPFHQTDISFHKTDLLLMWKQ